MMRYLVAGRYQRCSRYCDFDTRAAGKYNPAQTNDAEPPFMPQPIAPAKPCIFCLLDRPVLAESDLARAFADAYPVSPGHTLIVPKRHVRTIFDTSAEEYAACFALLREVRDLLQARHQPQGFNFGANCEVAGGQSVWHAHLHLIPRYTGDTADPLGGVRNVIPRKHKPGPDSAPSGRLCPTQHFFEIGFEDGQQAFAEWPHDAELGFEFRGLLTVAAGIDTDEA